MPVQTTLRGLYAALLVAIGSCHLPLPSHAEPGSASRRIALVLEGGGALGFAHVGVLKVLEEERIPVHLITGTSMGAIVGAAYASGRSMPELEAVMAATDWEALFDETAPRRMVTYREKPGREQELFGAAKLGIRDGEVVVPPALVEGEYIELFCQELFGKSRPAISFDDLPIPYRAIAADLETGEEVVLDRGSLAQAARASMSVPGFFTPVEIGGRVLVDGGMVNNFPVDVALAMGADVVIGVQFTQPLRTRAELTGPVSILAQVLDLFLIRTSERGLALMRDRDVLIQPDVSAFSSTKFDEAQAIMKAGERAARALAERLREFAVSPEEYARYQRARTTRSEFAPAIDFVLVEGVRPDRRERLERGFRAQIGRALDRDFMEQRIREAYQSGEYRKIGYDLVERDGAHGLVIRAQPKEWRRNYLRFGASIEDDFDGSSFHALAVDVRMTELNDWGAYADAQLEIGKAPRLFLEHYQPLGAGSRLFVAPDLTLARQGLTVRDGGDEVARYDRESAVLGLKGGVSFGRFGEFTAGWRRGPGRLERDLGDPALPEFDYDVGEIVTRFILDQYDNPDFPTEGYRIALSGTASRDALGASDAFELARVLAGVPFTVGRWTMIASGEAGFSSDDLPVERSYALGGMFDISGYEQSSLTADNYWVGRSVLFYRFLEGDSALLDLGGYLGGTLEYASLRSEVEAIGDDPGIVAGSLFVGFDTPVLPVYLAFGASDESERSIYLNIGRLNARRR